MKLKLYSHLKGGSVSSPGSGVYIVVYHKQTTSACWTYRIDNLHISHNASGMGANIRVLLIRNSSSHSSLDVNGLELPCLAATMCFTRLRNQW